MVKRERYPSSLCPTTVTLPSRNSLIMTSGFMQHSSDGLTVEEKTTSVFMVPDGLTPTTLLNSPPLWNNLQGAGSVQSYSLLAIPSLALTRYPPSTSSETTCQQQQRPQFSSSGVHKPDDDGYNWRKYGQKQVKGHPRSYYKCTQATCPVKKKVERSILGQITEIIYKGKHNHQPPQATKVDMDNTYLTGISNNHEKFDFSCDHNNCSEYLLESSDHGDEDGAQSNNGEPIAKRRSTEARITGSVASHKTVTEQKIIVQAMSEIDLLDDGYRWRKYGQKVVKGNPYPRSYYKCISEGCKVRKHVERAATDPKAVVTTYEGIHNHNVPAPRRG